MKDDSDSLIYTARRRVFKFFGVGAATVAASSGRVAGDHGRGREGGGPEGGRGAGDGGDQGRGNSKRPAAIDENLGFTLYDPENIVPFENRVAETVNLNVRVGTYLLTDEDGNIETDDERNVKTKKQESPKDSEPNGLGPKERVPQPPEGPSLGVEFYFDPVGLRVTPGDIVEFRMQLGHHAVVSYHPDNDRQRRIPADASSFTSPMLGGAGNEFENDDGRPKTGLEDVDRGGKSQKWYYRFEDEGVYDLYCPSHETFGMVMRVIVLEEGNHPSTLKIDTAPSAETLGNEGRESIAFLPPIGFAGSVLGWPNLTPDSIVNGYDGSVSWNQLFIGTGGLEDTSGSEG